MSKPLSPSSPLLGQLAAIVGDAHVLTQDLTAFETDWRGRTRGRALAVVRPGNTAEVAGVVRACMAHQTAIVPQGGNTGLVLGGVPNDSGQELVLSLQRMRGIRSVDVPNLTMTVEAGCVLQTVQEAAAQANCLFPLSLAAEGSCTIGGNLATNAGGTQVLRYGNARELCLGLEVVTAQGEIWNGLSGLRKDNTGYDLRDLFIGSEGTLGVITAATLKLFPQPRAKLTAWAVVASMDQAVALLGLAQKHLASHLTGFEVMGHFALSLVAKHFAQQRMPLWPCTAPFCVLLEASDPASEARAREQFEALFEAAFACDCVQDAVIAENMAQAKALWHVRESIPLAQAQEGLNIKHDISLPISAIAAFCDSTDALLHKAAPGARLVNFGHLGDGNLHYNLQCPADGDAAAFLTQFEHPINQLVYAQVKQFGGSISAEHGIGLLKREALQQHQSGVALHLMRQIKAALDPHHVMNPGRVL